MFSFATLCSFYQTTAVYYVKCVSFIQCAAIDMQFMNLSSASFTLLLFIRLNIVSDSIQRIFSRNISNIP